LGHLFCKSPNSTQLNYCERQRIIASVKFPKKEKKGILIAQFKWEEYISYLMPENLMLNQ